MVREADAQLELGQYPLKYYARDNEDDSDADDTEQEPENGGKKEKINGDEDGEQEAEATPNQHSLDESEREDAQAPEVTPDQQPSEDDEHDDTQLPEAALEQQSPEDAGSEPFEDVKSDDEQVPEITPDQAPTVDSEDDDAQELKTTPASQSSEEDEHDEKQSEDADTTSQSSSDGSSSTLPGPQLTLGKSEPEENGPNGGEGRDTAEDGEQKTGIIYARVSSNEQVDKGSSIDGQIDELESIADERNIDLVDDPVRDEGKSGTDFEREGIRKVFRLANEMSLSYVLVDSIDRLGRAAAQTLYFIYVLQEDCQTTVITSTGELNINQVKDLMQIYQTTLMAEMETKGRARSALRSRARGFLVDNKWKSWFHQIPFGYEEDGDWIKPARMAGWFAKWMFEHYRNTESIKKTKEILNKNEDILGRSFTRSQVKSYLQKKVYVGQPTIPVENIHHYEDDNSVYDENLQLITEDLYADVQDIIMKNQRKYSSDSDAKSKKDFINEFGMFPVAESSPIVELHCPDCGTELIQDGQRTTWGGWDQHVYRCPAPEEVCRRRPTWPTEVDLTLWVMLKDPEFQEHLPHYPEYDGYV